jgi:hypothetical protein
MNQATQVAVSEVASVGLISFKWRGAASLERRFAHMSYGELHTIDEVDLALIAPGEVLAFPPRDRLPQVIKLFGAWAGEEAHAITDVSSGWCALSVTGVGSSQALSNLGGIPRGFLKSAGSVSAFWMLADRVIVRTILPDHQYLVWLSRSRLHSFPLTAAIN